jgi:hypothetical protein
MAVSQSAAGVCREANGEPRFRSALSPRGSGGARSTAAVSRFGRGVDRVSPAVPRRPVAQSLSVDGEEAVLDQLQQSPV